MTKKMRTINAISVQTHLVMDLLAEMHQYTSEMFDKAVSAILELKDQPGRSKRHQAYIEELSELQIRSLGRNSLAILEVYAADIVKELSREGNDA